MGKTSTAVIVAFLEVENNLKTNVSYFEYVAFSRKASGVRVCEEQVICFLGRSCGDVETTSNADWL